MLINTYTTYYKLKEIYDICESGRYCVLFIDEINRTEFAVQQELMQLILDRQINTFKLPENCMILAAGNPETDDNNDYQVNVMNDALKSRFTFLEMTSDPNEWLRWASTIVKEKDENGKINKRTLIDEDVIEFIADNPELLHVPNSTDSVKPNPRSWEKVSNAKSIFKLLGYADNILHTVVKGNVGTIASLAFMKYLGEKSNPLLKIEEILDKSGMSEKVKNKIKSESIPRLTIVSRRLINFLNEQKKLEKYMTNNFIEFCSYIPKDSMVGLIADLYNNYKSLYDKLSNIEEFLDLFYDTHRRLHTI